MQERLGNIVPKRKHSCVVKLCPLEGEHQSSMMLAVSATVLEKLDWHDVELVPARIKSWKDSIEMLHNHPELEDSECDLGRLQVEVEENGVWAGKFLRCELQRLGSLSWPFPVLTLEHVLVCHTKCKFFYLALKILHNLAPTYLLSFLPLLICLSCMLAL